MSTLKWFRMWAGQAMTILLVTAGCGQKAGEPCEQDDDCSGDMECEHKTCDDGRKVGFCTVVCESLQDCEGFSRPSCSHRGDLGRYCIEVEFTLCQVSP